LGSKCVKASGKILLKSTPELLPGVNFIKFYAQIFRMKVLCTAFLQFHFWFCNFWRKNICAKGLHKMLMKLTPELLVNARTWRYSAWTTLVRPRVTTLSSFVNFVSLNYSVFPFVSLCLLYLWMIKLNIYPYFTHIF